jgi:hypothetical protein
MQQPARARFPTGLDWQVWIAVLVKYVFFKKVPEAPRLLAEDEG